MRKKLMALALAVLFVMTVAASAFAVDIMPYWNTTNTCTPSLYISGNTANCSLTVVANSGDSITATVTLQKENARGNYSNVKAWPNLSDTTRLYFSDSYTFSSSGNYRLKADVTVTGTRGTDNITVYAY